MNLFCSERDACMAGHHDGPMLRVGPERRPQLQSLSMATNGARAPADLSQVHRQLLGAAARGGHFLHDSFVVGHSVATANTSVNAASGAVSAPPQKRNLQLSIPAFQYRNGHTVFYEIRVTEVVDFFAPAGTVVRTALALSVVCLASRVRYTYFSLHMS